VRLPAFLASRNQAYRFHDHALDYTLFCLFLDYKGFMAAYDAVKKDLQVVELGEVGKRRGFPSSPNQGS
jgi:hypothetical protein